jgi:aerobic carbon-monoxide dehydrogenase medium subunit
MDFEIINATTTDELLKAIKDNQHNNFKIGAGYTDLILELKQQAVEDLTIINIAQLYESSFNAITEEDDYIVIGALVTASDIVNSKIIKELYPVLYQATLSVASTQIRNLATIGGNICHASPSADMSAALVALQAKCTILNSEGKKRTEPLVTFIQDVRKTSLAKNEILKSITIQKNSGANIKSGFEKVGTRNSMECSIVSLSYHIQYKNTGVIEKAGVSCGAVAPVIPYATSACDFFIGKNIKEISETDRITFAKKVLAYASPISDIRASEWYRKEVLFNLSKTIFE